MYVVRSVFFVILSLVISSVSYVFSGDFICSCFVRSFGLSFVSRIMVLIFYFVHSFIRSFITSFMFSLFCLIDVLLAGFRSSQYLFH